MEERNKLSCTVRLHPTASFFLRHGDCAEESIYAFWYVW